MCLLLLFLRPRLGWADVSSSAAGTPLLACSAAACSIAAASASAAASAMQSLIIKRKSTGSRMFRLVCLHNIPKTVSTIWLSMYCGSTTVSPQRARYPFTVDAMRYSSVCGLAPMSASYWYATKKRVVNAPFCTMLRTCRMLSAIHSRHRGSGSASMHSCIRLVYCSTSTGCERHRICRFLGAMRSHAAKQLTMRSRSAVFCRKKFIGRTSNRATHLPSRVRITPRSMSAMGRLPCRSLLAGARLSAAPACVPKIISFTFIFD